MALTRSFKLTLAKRLRAEPDFANALLREAVQELIAGDLDAGRSVLRQHIHATIGFARLGKLTGTPPKSLMRMLGPNGNPQARHLLAILGTLQRAT